ncbi:MAG: hypothetical protein ABW321_10335 [Polyangiales bacterium]
MSHAFDVCASARLAALVGLSCTLLACAASDPDRNPSEVLAHFIEAMDRSAHDETALKDAFALLDAQARHELEARAERTSSLAGRNFAPWEMIAPGRFRLRFAPSEHAGMRATVKGEDAVVHVKSDDGRKANVPLIREQGRWRVKLDLTTSHPSDPDAP